MPPMLQHILNLEKSTEYEARNHIRVHSKKSNSIINRRDVFLRQSLGKYETTMFFLLYIVAILYSFFTLYGQHLIQKLIYYI